MKKILAMTMVLCLVLALCAGCGSKEEGASWEDYQAYLIEKAGSNAPDLDEFKAQIEALESWEDIDTSVSPWDQMFSTIGLSTWDEFKAGTVKEPAVSGGMDASASGEMGGASDEAAADGSVPDSGTAENTAHGTATADMAGYQEYLHAWLESEFAANSTMDETMKGEFEALIDAADFETFPADMLYNGMLTTGSAMTYDEFVAAGGAY